MAEFFVNNFTTSLNGAIDNSTTSITLTSVSGAPAAGDFRVVVDNEIMLAQGTLTGTTWTVVRGQEGTSPAAHANGAAVKHDLTAGILNLFCTAAQEASDIGALGSPYAAINNTALVGTGAPATWSAGNVLDDMITAKVPNMASRGFKIVNGDPRYTSGTATMTSTLLYVMQMPVVGTQAVSTVHVVNGSAAGTITAALATASTGASNIVNGSGNITPANGASFTLTTTSMSGYNAGGWVTLGNGTDYTPVATMAYSAWSGTSMTVVAGSYPVSTTLNVNAHIYTINNGVAVYDSTGQPLAAPPDQSAVGTNGQQGWNQSGQKVLQLGKTLSLSSNVYVGWVATASVTPTKPAQFNTTVNALNVGSAANLTGANLLFGTLGNQTIGQLPATITPSSIVVTNAAGVWVGMV